MSAPPELTCVRYCPGLLLAELYKSKLEAAGIPVLLQYESAGPVIGITVDGLGEVRVMVPAEFASDALALLEEEPEGQGDDPEAAEAQA